MVYAFWASLPGSRVIPVYSLQRDSLFGIKRPRKYLHCTTSWLLLIRIDDHPFSHYQEMLLVVFVLSKCDWWHIFFQKQLSEHSLRCRCLFMYILWLSPELIYFLQGLSQPEMDPGHTAITRSLSINLVFCTQKELDTVQRPNEDESLSI